MSITSTVPGAVAVLGGYMTTVANANPGLKPGVYLGGTPVAQVADRFMMCGSYEEGLLIAPDTYKWAAIPGQAKLRSESYALIGTIRAWAGDSDPITRLGEAFTLLDGLHEQVASDLGGSGSLSPSGSWGDLDVTNLINGPLGGTGWGVVLQFELHVINAQLQG